LLIKGLGDITLSRTLGDSEFKKAKSLGPENQIITADPEVTVHNITIEDKFIMIACDGKLHNITSGFYPWHSYKGIWGCMSSQRVVDVVHLKIFEGQKLNQISEMLYDHCLAPESVPMDDLSCGSCSMLYCSNCYDLVDSGHTGTGCDNMTIAIVAVLNGQTKDEWYTWITDHIKENYGYKTPRSPPWIYPEHKLKSFKAQWERKEEQDRRRAAQGSGEEQGSPNSKMVEDARGGLALAGGPSGLCRDMVRSVLVELLACD
jgi:protein phosphatase PTC2/3